MAAITICSDFGAQKELPDVQAGFRKGRGTRDQTANINWIIEKVRELQKNIYFCFIDCAKTFDCVDYNKLWKILKEMGIPDHLTLTPVKPVCRSRNNRTGHRTTGSKLGEAIYYHPAYLISIQSTSCEMLGWMKHKLESRFQGEISTTSDVQMTPP